MQRVTLDWIENASERSASALFTQELRRALRNAAIAHFLNYATKALSTHLRPQRYLPAFPESVVCEMAGKLILGC